MLPFSFLVLWKKSTNSSSNIIPVVNSCFMQATYSFPEIKSLIRSLDYSSVNILEELIEEEKECYSQPELRALHRFLQLKNKQFIRNEVQFEYLLSFN